MLTVAPPAPATTHVDHDQATPRSRWVDCSHTLGGLPCMNHQPHTGNGRGCVHYSRSGVPDRHGDDS